MNTTAETVQVPFTPKSTSERMFPSFTAAQIGRLALQGHCRTVAQGEMLFEAGASTTPFL